MFIVYVFDYIYVWVFLNKLLCRTSVDVDFFFLYRLDSFVLAETFKYLYLLFSEEKDLVVPVNEYIFTTEAHLLPLTLSLINASTIETKVGSTQPSDSTQSHQSIDQLDSSNNSVHPLPIVFF